MFSVADNWCSKETQRGSNYNYFHCYLQNNCPFVFIYWICPNRTYVQTHLRYWRCFFFIGEKLAVEKSVITLLLQRIKLLPLVFKCNATFPVLVVTYIPKKDKICFSRAFNLALLNLNCNLHLLLFTNFMSTPFCNL